MSLFEGLSIVKQAPRAAKNSTPVTEMGIEEARAAVLVRANPHGANEEAGTEELRLRLGKLGIALDVIEKGCVGVTVTADNKEAVSAQLLDAVAQGAFDEAIVAAQEKAKEVAAKKQIRPAKEVASDAELSDLDLDELDAEEPEVEAEDDEELDLS